MNPKKLKCFQHSITQRSNPYRHKKINLIILLLTNKIIFVNQLETNLNHLLFRPFVLIQKIRFFSKKIALDANSQIQHFNQ